MSLYGGGSGIMAQVPIAYAQAMAPIVAQIDNSTANAFGSLTANLPQVTAMSSNAYNFLGGANNALTASVSNFGLATYTPVVQATAASNATVNTLGNQAVTNYQLLAQQSGKKKK